MKVNELINRQCKLNKEKRDLHKKLEEAAEKFSLEKCKRKRIDETYSIYPTFLRQCKEEYIEISEDVWKEAIKIGKEWLLNNANDYKSAFTCAVFHQQLAEAFEADMNKLLEE